jgi:hypothetical protein
LKSANVIDEKSESVFRFELENKYQFDQFKKKVISNPETLFLMVVDECHWGCNQSGIHNTMVNDDELAQKENLFTLLVSATPYNVLSDKSRIEEKYLIDGKFYKFKNHKTKKEDYELVSVTNKMDVKKIPHSSIFEWLGKYPEHRVVQWETQIDDDDSDMATYKSLNYYFEHRESKNTLRKDDIFESISKGNKDRILDALLIADYGFRILTKELFNNQYDVSSFSRYFDKFYEIFFHDLPSFNLKESEKKKDKFEFKEFKDRIPKKYIVHLLKYLGIHENESNLTSMLKKNDRIIMKGHMEKILKAFPKSETDDGKIVQFNFSN